MSGVFVRLDWLTGLKIAIGGALILWSNSTLAQVTPDTTLGAESSVVTPNVEIRGVVSDRVDGGAIRGANLFHSFQEFNVREGRGVYFTNPQGIENILSRVTGANRSEILGRLGVLGNANLFLINPSGIVFGQNASLDVEGSFVATTASSFKFSNGTQFSATNPNAPPLLTMSITPGLQYGSSQPGAAIESVGNLASKQDLTLVSDRLELSGQLSSGKNLSLGSVSGGLAQINSQNTPILSALGDIDVAANYTGASLLVEALGNIRFGGEINITQPATGLPNGLDTLSLSNSSALILRSGQNALVYADNTLGNAPAAGGLEIPQGITLSGDVILEPFNGVGGIVNFEAGKGDITTQLISTNGQQESSLRGINANGGAITLNAANGSISTGNLLSYSSSFSDSGTAGNGGAITLKARVNLDTGDVDSYSDANYYTAAGNGGVITLSAGLNINTRNLRSYSHSRMETAGNGGAITLSAGGDIETESFGSYSYSFVGTARDGGAITLCAGANIKTEYLGSYSRSRLDKAGNGGAITLNSKVNINTEDLDSYSFSSSNTAGDGGAIALSAGVNINTEDLDSSSSSNSGTAGAGGAISLSAGDTIKFQGSDVSFQGSFFSLIWNETFFPNSVSINSSGATGTGDITINSNAPFVLDNGAISSDTFGSGKAGDIQITSPSISLTNGAQLSASTHSTGTGGNITLIATDTVELSGETIKRPRGIFVQKDSSNIIGLPSVIYFGGYIPNGTTSQPPDGTVFPSGVFSQTTTNSTGSAGNLKIETGTLIVNNGAAIATTTFGQNSNAGNISIQAKDSILVDNGSILSGVAGGARGNSGMVDLQTRVLSITGGGVVQTQTLGEGKAGTIRVTGTDGVNAADTVNLSGKDSALRSGSGGSNNLLGTTGSNIGQGGDINVTTNKLTITDEAILDATTQTNSQGGDITVVAETLTIEKGGQLLTSTSGNGQAGDITVKVPEIKLSGSKSGLIAQTDSNGKAGDVNIITEQITLTDEAQISAATSNRGQGGSITVTAPKFVSFGGNSQLSVETSGSGKAGNVTISTDLLTVEKQASISATSTRTATTSEQGGSITLSANRINLFGKVGIFAETQGDVPAGSLSLQPYNDGRTLDVNFAEGASISASTSGSGQGGSLIVRALEAVTIQGNGQLAVETRATGDAGDATIDTQNLTIQDGAKISASTSGSGQGGSITVKAPEAVTLVNNGQLVVETSGSGSAGNVTIKNTSNLTIQDGSKVSVSTTPNSSGQGGNIDIQSSSLTLNKGEISARTQGVGNGGNITIGVTGLFSATNSEIVTSATQSSAGAIAITAKDIRLDGDSDITTNVETGTGGGGDITLNANSIIAFDDSDILAFARDGKGGNITLNTPAFFGQNYRKAPSGTNPNTLDGNNRVDINASGAISSGVVTLPDTSFIQESLSELPENVIDTGSLIANSCIARGSRQLEGNFVITGSGGLPTGPGNVLMSQYTFGTARTVSNTVPSANSPRRPWQKGDPIVEPQGVYQLSSGQLVLSRECAN